MKFFNSLAAAGLLGAAAAEMNANGQYLKLLKQIQWDETRNFDAATRARFPSAANQATSCNDNTGVLQINGEDFPCKNIDFEGFISLDNMLIDSNTKSGSDIWGWLSPDGREITIMCVNNGVWFVDGTVPSDPKILGSMAAKSSRGSQWCDVKVYKDTAYVVKDASSPDNGIQVFDLNRLNSLTGVAPEDFEDAPKFVEDFFYDEIGDVHNILIDNDTGFGYCVGSRASCRGGLHIIDLNTDPLHPTFVSCFSEDGYTHDAQCVVYDGPDNRYTGAELCFNFNEDTLTIVDVSDKQNIVVVARQKYDGVEYSHQGWLSADMKWVLLDDELDESRDRQDKRTKTMIVNVEDLENPVFESKIVHGDESIDHNLYFWGPIHAKGWGGNPPMSNPPLPQYAYLSNYAAGIQVVDMSEIETGVVRRAGFFDCAPEYDSAKFHGTWSNYMHPSGVLAVSSIERGLFLITPRMAFADFSGGEVMETESMLQTAAFEPVAENVSEESDNKLADAVVALAITVAAALVVIPLTALVAVKRLEKAKKQDLNRSL